MSQSAREIVFHVEQLAGAAPPDSPRRPHMKDATREQKLAAYSERQPSGCLLWHGNAAGKKRGVIRDGAVVVSAHRLAWEKKNGPIPPGFCVLSTCPAGHGLICIEPDHLTLGTQGDVNRETVARGRRARRHRRRQRVMVEGDL